MRAATAVMIAGCFITYGLSASLDREHQVKTGFIFSIAKFCEWDFSKKSINNFIVGVYRTRAYDLDIELLNGKTIHGRPILVEQIKAEADISRCQIVVVGDVGPETLKRCINHCKGSGTILVGESEGFAKDGGTVGFVLKDGNVRFQVNLQTAQVDRVTFSSKLLILAEQVFR